MATAKETNEVQSDDLGAVRSRLVELAAEGRIDDLIELVIDLLARVRHDNSALTLRLRNALRIIYGRKSEKISAEQLSLMFDELKGAAPAIAKEIVDEAKGEAPQPPDAGGANGPKQEKPRKPRDRGGRSPLPPGLPRVEKNNELSAADRLCKTCGKPRHTIGYLVSEILEFIPAQLIVIEERREKVACSDCDGCIETAPSEKVMDRGRPGPNLLATIVVSKLEDSLPLYRQSKMLGRDSVYISDSTLGDWFAFATDVIAPIAALIGKCALASGVINTDDTTLRVLDRTHPKGSRTGRMWSFLGDRKWAAFLYAPDWKAEHPGEFLEHYTGFVQGDGYAGYSAQVGPPGHEHIVVPDERRLGCGMHVRRPFEAATKLGDARGAIAIALFRKLYAIERTCKDEQLTTEQRHLRRQEQSIPVLVELKNWIDTIHPTLIPKEPLYKATTYARNQWSYFMRCFSDGRFEIDNGAAERELRRIVLGENNFLFAGSDKGAERLAIGYTIVATCMLQGVNPVAYVADVIELLQAGWPVARLAELLPERWQQTRAAEAAARTHALLRSAKLPDLSAPAVAPPK